MLSWVSIVFWFETTRIRNNPNIQGMWLRRQWYRVAGERHTYRQHWSQNGTKSIYTWMYIVQHSTPHAHAHLYIYIYINISHTFFEALDYSQIRTAFLFFFISIVLCVSLSYSLTFIYLVCFRAFSFDHFGFHFRISSSIKINSGKSHSKMPHKGIYPRERERKRAK